MIWKYCKAYLNHRLCTNNAVLQMKYASDGETLFTSIPYIDEIKDLMSLTQQVD